MATKKFVGNAPSIKQVDTYTPASVSIGHTFWLICNGKVTATFTATTTVVADVVAGLYAILTSTSQPPPAEFLDVTWTNNTTYLGATSKTYGQPFTFTTGGTGTLTQATTVTPSSPNDLSITSNWADGSLPANSDTIIFENGSTDVLYGLDRSGVTSVTIRVEPSYSGRFGLPRRNTSGYTEYRETYVKWGITSLIYAGTGNRAKFDAGATACVMQINDTATSGETGLETLLVRGSSLTAVYVTKGSVAVAPYADETSTLITAKTTGSSASIRLGSGCAVTQALLVGGTINANQNLTVATLDAGSVLTQNKATGTTGTLTNGGTYYHNSQGTITTYVGRPNGVLDLTKALVNFTISSTSIQTGHTIKDSYSRATYTGGIALSQCHVADVKIDVGISRTLSIA